MRIAINDTYATTTVGWHQAAETADGILVAPTFISSISILIAVATLAAKSRNKEPEANRYFDPGNILHTFSAASAGGMQTPFPPFHENKVDQRKNIMITLVPVNGGNSRPGFINLN